MEMNADFFFLQFLALFSNMYGQKKQAFILLDMQEFFSEMIYIQDKN